MVTVVTSRPHSSWMAGLRPTILYPGLSLLVIHIPFYPRELQSFLFRWLKKHKRPMTGDGASQLCLNPSVAQQRACWEDGGKNEHHDVFPVLESPLECNLLELVINSSNKYLLSTCSGSEPALVQDIKQWIKETNSPSSWRSHFYNCLGILFLFILLLKPAFNTTYLNVITVTDNFHGRRILIVY